MIERISDIGNIRELNEDTFGVHEDEEYNLFIICDGMGGHNAGEVASALAKDTIIDTIGNSLNGEDPMDSMVMAVKRANDKIYTISKADNSLNGMGTTVTAALSYRGKLFVTHVGDSSLYVLEKGKIRKITKDHSLVQELVDSGKLDKEDAKHHPNKNIITRAVGTNREVMVDTYTMETSADDLYILCTDGLTDYISDEEILEVILRHDNKREAIIVLKDLAKERGGKDNITLVIFGGEALK